MSNNQKNDDSRLDTTIKIYVYRDGRDFIAPDLLGNRQIPFLATSPVTFDGFEEVMNPDHADYLVFPYYLEKLTEHCKIKGMWDFLLTLQHFKFREMDHVFFSDHDSSVPYVTKSVWFRSSVNRFERDPSCYAIPFLSDDLRGGNTPDISPIHFHTSFVGYCGNLGERLPLLQAIAKEPRLVSHIDVVRLFHSSQDNNTRVERRQKYIDSLRSSLTVLCPRGEGENSIRFFETFSAGRIPVLVADNALLPMEDVIPYQECMLQIGSRDLEHAGSLLFEWLTAQNDNQLINRCHTARVIWDSFFSSTGFPTLVLKTLRGHITKKERTPPWNREDHRNAERLAVAAREKLQNGMSHEAETLLIQALVCNPRDAAIYYDLGVALYRQERNPDAEQALRKAIAYDNRHFWAYVGLGDVLSLAHNAHSAIPYYQMACLIDPSHPLPRKKLHDIVQSE